MNFYDGPTGVFAQSSYEPLEKEHFNAINKSAKRQKLLLFTKQGK